MEKYLFEFLGTLVLILMGDSVVANVCLNKTKGQGSGWVVITMAWGFAVMCGVFVAGPISGAHLNPALTLGLAAAGSFPWSDVFGYIVAQILGGIVGGWLVWVFYKDHFNATEDQATKLGCFCTIPAIRNYWRNFISEVIGTCVLVFIIMAFATQGNTAEVGLGSSGAFPVTMLIMAIGMSLGGTTGYAINPARDLGPRIAHAILPIKGKGSSDWAYSWVPICGPVVGALLAAGLFVLVF
ncbi:MAG: aquaporin family protein [Bacteroidales bacterium]|nr:aquaporin family protein [Bacteroidales bacterium]MBO7480082.1 aquaporin family protein [Bacteroidales bacterium]MBO7488530.1 aquaporin family protein [Bacteroidales bacterium]